MQKPEEEAAVESDVDSLEEAGSERLERWEPLGADASSISPDRTSASNAECSFRVNTDSDLQRMKELEDEQEQLNSALLELTTHFAQVQFRLDQIAHAPSEEKEKLLLELSTFASKGCPDIMSVKKSTEAIKQDAQNCRSLPEDSLAEKQQARQKELIKQLRDQLQDLEQFAYDTGNSELPSSEVMMKQRVIIDSLQNKLDLHVDDQLHALTNEDLQKHVDQAVKKLINPLKIKDQLVDQLKTQIDDLHRFVDFLQTSENSRCTCLEEGDDPQTRNPCKVHHDRSFYGFGEQHHRKKQHDVSGLLNTLYHMQLYLLQQMGCQSKGFHKNELKRSSKGNHWGDVRAALELAIDKCVNLAVTEPERRKNEDEISVDLDDTEIEDVFHNTSEELLYCVRKQLSPTLRDVIQHGMLPSRNAAEMTVAPLGCIPARRLEHSYTNTPHAWDIVLKYFEMKNGKEFNDMPLRKLSQSFKLDNIGGKAITSKQMLLCTIDGIITSHTKLKRSSDAQWKAFVSAALNHKSLVPWLRMILRTREIIDECFAAWSYAARTGCDDALKSLERLSQFNFQLPVDLATMPFKGMRDAF